MDGLSRPILNQRKMLTLKRMTRRKNRGKKSRRKTYKTRKQLKQHGGLGQAYQIPPEAVVSASFQEPDNAYPILMSYRDYRQHSELPIFGLEPEKLIEPSPENPVANLEQNAEHAGREEVQIQQAFSGVQGSPSPRRRRSANRSRSKGPR